jgi:hypothetical protein
MPELHADVPGKRGHEHAVIVDQSKPLPGHDDVAVLKVPMTDPDRLETPHHLEYTGGELPQRHRVT